MRSVVREKLHGARAREISEMPVLRRSVGLHKERDLHRRGHRGRPAGAVDWREADGDEQDKAVIKSGASQKGCPASCFKAVLQGAICAFNRLVTLFDITKIKEWCATRLFRTELLPEAGLQLTKRTKYSLAQFLDLFGAEVGRILLEKHDISLGWGGYGQSVLRNTVLNADDGKIGRLLEELVHTNGDLKYRVSPRYRFNERWQDLTKCLLLDGYRIEGNSLTRVEPFLEGVEPIEDDLTKELQRSCLHTCEEIKNQIIASADDFRKPTPDYNGALSHARIALETLVRGIAENKGFTNAEDGKKAWGQSLSYIRENGIISDKEEKELASVYTFISEGSHVPIPVGFTKEEYVRFGRNLAISMCYFVIKLFNGKDRAGTTPF